MRQCSGVLPHGREDASSTLMDYMKSREGGQLEPKETVGEMLGGETWEGGVKKCWKKVI